MRSICARPLDIGALQRVVDGLGHGEELVAAVDHLPFGLDAESRSNATWVASSSATPPPYAVAFTCSTRAPASGAASSRMRSSVPGSTIRRSRRGACRATARVRAIDPPGATDGGQAVNLLRVTRAVVCPDKFRERCAPTRPRPRWLPVSRARGSTTSSSSRSPTEAKERSTRCSPHAAVRGASRASPVRSAIPSTREWVVLPGGDRDHRDGAGERARARRRAQRSAAGEHARHRRADRGGVGAGIQPGHRRGRRSATTDGGLAAVEALGWSLQGSRSPSRATSNRLFSTPRPCTDRRRARRGAQVALLDPPAAGSPMNIGPYRRRRHALTGGGAAGGLAGGLAAIGARARAGFDVVAEASASKPRSTAPTL